MANPRFAEDLTEIGGFGFSELERRFPACVEQPPRYIPVIQHQYLAGILPGLDWAAVPLREIFKFKNGRLRTVAESGSALRRRFGLEENTKILALGVDKDRFLELHWARSVADGCASGLARLGIALAVTPNFSMFLDEPRPQHLHNRKRILLSAANWAQHSVPPVVVLQAVTDSDWEYWCEFLAVHNELDIVALEFQTGLGNPLAGRGALRQISRIQEKLKRRLHVIAVGGSPFRSDLLEHFDSWSVVDSTPFMKAAHHQRCLVVRGRVRWARERRWLPARILAHNIRYRRAFVEIGESWYRSEMLN